MQPIGTLGGEVMFFVCVCFRGELGFLNCYDICMCVVNEQFDLLEFVFDSVYVDYCVLLSFPTRSISNPQSNPHFPKPLPSFDLSNFAPS